GAELPQQAGPPMPERRLTVLHFNDLHGRLAVFGRIAGWLAAERRRAAAQKDHVVLAVTAGDECGGALSDLLLGREGHPAYRLYSKAGVDLGVPGNHDLDLGAERLAQAIARDARFPLLAANVAGDAALATCCFPAAIFVAKGLRIGLIGLTTPAQVHPDPVRGRCVTDPLAAAHHLVPALRPLCDVLIIVSHLGLSLNQRSAVVEQAGDMELARGLPPDAVHLIIGGHTHTVLNESGLSPANVVNGIPIVQAGRFGQFVGEVEIRVGRTVEVTHACLRATIELAEDEAFAAMHVRPLLAQAEAEGRRVLGRVAADDDLSADAVRDRFAEGESALANFIADALVERCRAAGYEVDLAMIDTTSVNAGLRPGATLTLGDWLGVMPFGDPVCLLRLTGRELEALLRDNALRVDRPGEPHTCRGFLHFSAGVRYVIRLGPTRADAEAAAITVDGRPLAANYDRTFTIATTSFVRGPAAAWEAIEGARLHRPLFALSRLTREPTRLCARDLLLEHIAAHGGVVPEGGARRDGRVIVYP
ncbi:MAG: bifunctional metallophosphatase/5'-nucleotidase, partial [Anaerolineae bacterium]